MAMEPTRLPAFPRDELLPTAQLVGSGRELDVLARLGEPTSNTERDGERWFYWDLRWPCGLYTSVELGQVSEELRLHLDERDVDHALRHLGITVDATRPRGTAEDRWAVVEDDPGAGTVEDVVTGLTERDARCRAGEFEEAPAVRAVRSEGLPPVPVPTRRLRAERR